MPDINMQVFEEAKRNQLVTEVDIQTQVALDDYQVQLSDIANPTQSQDNVVIDRCGEFLPHWNESLDFDTWIKMSMEVAGKRILMLRGNPNVSSVSSISNTFLFGDTFDGTSLDTNKWDTVNSPTISVANSKVSVTSSSVAWRGITGKTAYSSDIIINFRGSMEVESVYYNFIGFDNNVDPNKGVGEGSAIFYFGLIAGDDKIWNVDGDNLGTNPVISGMNNNLHDYEIIWTSANVNYLVDGSSVGSISNVIPSISLKPSAGVYSTNAKDVIDYIFVRKYTSTEPTVTVGTLKNIVTTLKSLGRAG